MVGDEVAAIDEKTGNKVWRKVVGRYSRLAQGSLDITVEDATGKRSTITATSEHPFHIEKWDGKVETLLADLSPQAISAPPLSGKPLAGTPVDPSRLFPSEEKTPFGDWVKAGALKVGDKVSTLGSVADTVANDNAYGPRVAAANDNHPLTITDIVRDNAAARVYNFEVESRSGEITHNYFVGDDQAWVHNGRGFRGGSRDEVKRRNDYKCVRCGSPDDLQCDHIYPWSKGGKTDVKNGQPLCGRCNRGKSDSDPIPGLDLQWK